GYDHAELGRRLEELVDRGCRVDHLLEVVEHQQYRLVTKLILERIQDRTIDALADVEGAGDLRRDQRRIRDGGKLHEEDAVGVVGEAFGRHLERKPRLAGTARTGQRHQPSFVDEGAHLTDLAISAHEARQLYRQVV